MLKVLLASRNTSENMLLQKKLAPLSQTMGAIKFDSVRPVLVKNMFEAKYDLVIYNCHHFCSGTKDHIQHWRSLGFLGPILIIAKVPNPDVIGSL